MKELKTELIELINSDYADFINLSTNLNGVDRMMEDLRKPLDRMKNDAIVRPSSRMRFIGFKRPTCFMEAQTSAND